MMAPSILRLQKKEEKMKRATELLELARRRKDDFIMGTNDSSIVSKRSVSKLYYADEPDFYGPFVTKWVRRNPLINRGYWLRMYAIEQIVLRFLKEDSKMPKIVVNLGCGYDPLPFQLWHRHPLLSSKAIFVDVDYPQLVARKRDRMLTDDTLRHALLKTNLCPATLPVYLRSERYVALGCDLRDLKTLEKTLKNECNLAEASVLFVAEVSLTYMPVTDSDAIIAWASTLPNARFCMLEQYLPEGTDHPFAHTMLKHFDKLQTSIQAVKKYRSLSDHISRFQHVGWSSVVARSLWSLWTDDTFTPPPTRHWLDPLEPFDEWEEFALFGGHYFLLNACNFKSRSPLLSEKSGATNHEESLRAAIDDPPLLLLPYAVSSHSGWSPRRFGAACALNSEEVLYHGGNGTQSRLSSMDVLRREGSRLSAVNDHNPQARICHTITPLSGANALLVGGRTSPTHALVDCWLLECDSWSQVHDLSPGRFRHCSVQVASENLGSDFEGVLVFGGKDSQGMVLDTWILWTRERGWKVIDVDSPRPSERFGAAFSTIGQARNRGFLVGGMAPSGTVIEEIWEWRLTTAPQPQLQLFNRTPDTLDAHLLGRMGANLVSLGESLLLVGGVTNDELLGSSENFLTISALDNTTIQVNHPAISAPPSFRPLLIGVSVAQVSSNEIVVLGGGAVCFSMGSFWNKSYFTVTNKADSQPWMSSTTLEPGTNQVTQSRLRTEDRQRSRSKGAARPKSDVVVRLRIQSGEEFSKLVANSRPVILEGLDIGPCTTLWSTQYLKEKVGVRPVVVHQCSTDRMTFTNKNFDYVKKPFADFIDDISTGGRAYLRAVSSSQPNKLPTKLEDDFPTIAADFIIPQAIEAIKDSFHSSPLRVSGPVALWLHYDVLANVLCQVRGTKTLHLYPPSDVKYLSYPPGGSSASHDLASSNHASRLHLHIASIKPGDILFIPPMWSHTATPDDSISVAVNIFFRNLVSGYAAGKDVYGNRDLQAYENGRRDVERIAKAFKNLPNDMARFYLDRLMAELQEKANGFRTSSRDL